MGIPTAYVLVGLPGSGKSYYAEKIQNETDAIIISSDKIRENLFKNGRYQIRNSLVFSKVYERAFRTIESGRDCIIDATNTTMRSRGSLFNLAPKDLKFRKVAVVIATPFEQCKVNNIKRNKNTPEYIIHKHYSQFEVPFKEEGYDDIKLIRTEKCNNLTLNQMIKHMEDFIVNDNHHILPLDLHCKKCFELAKKQSNDNFFLLACLLHDYGKVFSKSFDEEREISHYYGHPSIGAYEVLTNFGDIVQKYQESDGIIVNNAYENSQKNALKLGFYICYHFMPKEWKIFKRVNKTWEKMLPDDVYNNLNILHECNMNSR